MIGALLFLSGIAAAWYGFSVGSFGYVMGAAVLLWLFAVVGFGRDTLPRYTSGKPPAKPSGRRRK